MGMSYVMCIVRKFQRFVLFYLLLTKGFGLITNLIRTKREYLKL